MEKRSLKSEIFSNKLEECSSKMEKCSLNSDFFTINWKNTPQNLTSSEF